MSAKYTCLDLFAGTCGFSAAMEQDPEWEVISVDITESFEREIALDPWGVETMTVETHVPHDIVSDVRDLEPWELNEHGPFDITLASPPCTTYSLLGISNHRDSNYQPITEKAERHDELVHHLYNLLHDLDTTYWVVENPDATLKRRPPFHEPEGILTWCQYGADVQKRTDLWGNIPEAFTFKRCSNGDPCHATAERGSDSGTQGKGVSADRARIPYGLSEALKEAVIESEYGHRQGSFLTDNWATSDSPTSPAPSYTHPYCPVCGDLIDSDQPICCEPLTKTEHPMGGGCPECGSTYVGSPPATAEACPRCNGELEYGFRWGPHRTTKNGPTDHEFAPTHACGTNCAHQTPPQTRYGGWIDDVCGCAGPPEYPDQSETHSNQHVVPENYNRVPVPPESEIIETPDGVETYTVYTDVYQCPNCEHIARAARRLVKQSSSDRCDTGATTPSEPATGDDSPTVYTGRDHTAAASDEYLDMEAR